MGVGGEEWGSEEWGMGVRSGGEEWGSEEWGGRSGGRGVGGEE